MIRRDYTLGCLIDFFNDAADTVIWLRSVGKRAEATELYNRLYTYKVQDISRRVATVIVDAAHGIQHKVD